MDKEETVGGSTLWAAGLTAIRDHAVGPEEFGMTNGTTMVGTSSLTTSNLGFVGTIVAATIAAVTIVSSPPESHLWETDDVQTKIVFPADLALQELRDVDVDVGLTMTFEDAARRGRMASSRLPDDLMDIDF